MIAPRSQLAPIAFDTIQIRVETRDRLRNLISELELEGYDGAIRHLLQPMVVAPKRQEHPGPRRLCGAPGKFFGRSIACRSRDPDHSNSPDPTVRSHVWWTYSGRKVRWIS